EVIVMGNKALALYPNPTRGEIWINYPDRGNENMIFRLHDTYGRLVYEQRIVESLSKIDLSFLGSGTYFYFIEGYKMTASGKILKVK
ncbi:MAG: T9SS type A sorting domain-containing protein, partial [candidate division WOR-3 bacterium]